MRPDLIGMLHVPVNTILAAPAAHREALDLPRPAAGDWDILDALPPPGPAVAGRALAEARRLSFLPFLEARVLGEAAIYRRHGFPALMLENVAAPYFVRGAQPPALYWTMRLLAASLRAAHPEARIGLQVLAFSDDAAMDIACRCGLDFIRCESALFEGVRPEGRTPNRGNLAQLYLDRQRLLAREPAGRPEPQVYVDLQKKHTVFPDELLDLDGWLENILFLKLEGVIITGTATGREVEESDLRRAREAIERTKEYTQSKLGRAWAPPLVVGSGVTCDNAARYARWADALIVGSSLKERGYWECPVDESRVAAMAASIRVVS